MPLPFRPRSSSGVRLLALALAACTAFVAPPAAPAAAHGETDARDFQAGWIEQSRSKPAGPDLEWRGRTDQDRPTRVVVSGRDHKVIYVRIGYTLECQRSSDTHAVVFVRPLRINRTAMIMDSGPYVGRRPGGVTARLSTRMRARLDQGVWRGTLTVRARMVRAGEVVDVCKLARTRWSASRSG